MLTSTPTMAAPVFVKYGDVSNNENIHILLFDIVNELTLNQCVGIQRYRSIFKIYVKEEGARLKLIEHGIVINSNIIKVFPENPYDKNNNTVKITIKLPLEYSNCDLLLYLRSLKNIYLKSNVMYCKERRKMVHLVIA